MARIYGIKKRLEENQIDEKTIKQIIGNSNLINTITQMEKLLDPDMMHDILDSQTCGGGKDFIKRCEKIGKEIAGKTLSEKINHINSISPDSEKITLNSNNTLTVVWSFNDNGINKCVCSAAFNKGVKVSELTSENNDNIMPLSYCYCCAGSGRRHMQLQLGVELKTKEVISSPINSKGQKPCKFIFAIVK